jgi:hypothetical protein
MPCLNVFSIVVLHAAGVCLNLYNIFCLNARRPPRWEYHRRNFVALAPEFNGFVRQFATSPEDINALLLGDVHPSLHGTIHFTRNGGFFQLWHQALPHIAFFVVHVSHSRNVLLREMGFGPSRITRMGRRPDG